ncbi:MAG: DUF72 domain-containing protein [Caldimicrobium sp.]|nr:DUF72 domain-containing protein [Caldimicrobium sp.]MCX7872991.1 DUF72 domain-containing protein [Caldimicrobium sp.]
MNQRAYYIGTSGWNYVSFKGIFYPRELPSAQWLRFYAQYFDTVELNVTFYRTPRPSTFQKWYEETPSNFVFSVKAPRIITHFKRLREVKEPLIDFLKSLQPLKEKARALLFQLPPSLSFNRELMEAFLPLLPKDFDIAIETRHQSFQCEEWIEMLRKYNLSLCLSDCGKRYASWFEVKTTDFLYLRLHGSKELYVSEYTEEELQSIVAVIKRLNPKYSYVYFDNTARGFAIKNALRLKELLEGH